MNLIKNEPNATENELARLAAVERFKSFPEAVHLNFIAAANILQTVTRTPIAGFSLLGKEKQWFTSAMGGELIETERSQSFCQYAVTSDTPLVITNARYDPDYEKHPLVTGDPHLQFYFGLCVRDADRQPLGALCAADLFPRSIDATAYAIAVNLRNMLENLLIVASSYDPFSTEKN